MIIFYALFLLYVFSAATLVSDLVTLVIEVSGSTYNNVITYRLCSRVSGQNHFKNKLPWSSCYFAFQLSKRQRAVVATSSPNVS